MDDGWQVDGFIVVAPLVSARDLQVWRARDRATGKAVVLRRLPPGVNADSVQAVIDGLRDVPFVCDVRRVTSSAEAAVVVHDVPAGGTLATLLEGRSRLS